MISVFLQDYIRLPGNLYGSFMPRGFALKPLPGSQYFVLLRLEIEQQIFDLQFMLRILYLQEVKDILQVLTSGLDPRRFLSQASLNTKKATKRILSSAHV